MEMESGKRYYWLKLKRDFFKRHDIRIIENMENGKDYLLFYLKLLVESVDHDGKLRFSDTVPYNEFMLSVVTNTNVDIVRSAMKVFLELDMMTLLEDETIYMNEVEKMIGSAADNDNAKRQQRFRDKKKSEKLGLPGDSVTNNNNEVTYDVTNNNESKSKSKSIESDKDKEKRKKEKKEKPTRHRHGEYNHVLLTDEEYERLLSDFGEQKIAEYIRKVDEYCQERGKTYNDYNLTIRKWIRNENPKPNNQWENLR